MVQCKETRRSFQIVLNSIAMKALTCLGLLQEPVWQIEHGVDVQRLAKVKGVMYDIVLKSQSTFIYMDFILL